MLQEKGLIKFETSLDLVSIMELIRINVRCENLYPDIRYRIFLFTNNRNNEFLVRCALYIVHFSYTPRDYWTA